MLVWLSDLLENYVPFFRLFDYLTFRAIVSVLTALVISLWMGPRMIARLQMLQIGQVVRNEGSRITLQQAWYANHGRHHDLDCHRGDRALVGRFEQPLRMGSACRDLGVWRHRLYG